MIDAIAAGRPVKAQDDPNALNPDGQLLQRREREMAERLYEELQALVKSLFKGLSAAQVAIILSRLDDPEYGKPLRDALIAELQTTATAGVNHGWVQIEALSAILDEAAWATSNTAAAEWATTYGYSLIRGLTDTTRPLIAAEVRRFIDNSMTMNQLRDRLMESAMFGRVRAERIAVTEVTRAFAEGNMAAWRASKVVEAREWMTATDEIVCPICAPLRGQIAKMGEPFGGRIMNPPGHVSCRCWILPVVIDDPAAVLRP